MATTGSSEALEFIKHMVEKKKSYQVKIIMPGNYYRICSLATQALH